jgi:geranylgeranyl reductase family protein
MAFDAVIIGAGPAGSTAARVLARSGARVAIVDGSHPREKACGGGVTARAMAYVPDGAVLGPIVQTVGTAVFEARTAAAPVPLNDRDVLRIFPRRDFDRALLDAAVAAGAMPVPHRATAIERDGTGWIVAAGPERIAASWLLGADGPSGVVRKRVFRPFRREQLSVAAGAFVDNVSADEIVVAFIDRPQGYLWSFPRRDHLAVGACAQADVTSPAELHAIVDRWLDRYPRARGFPRRRYAWPIPSLSVRDLDEEVPARDRWLLLGDAAGLVDPITREGIFFALQSGAFAAEALQTRNPPAGYTAAIRAEIHPELKRAARLRDAFFRPRFTSLLIEALNNSRAIQTVMVDLVGGRQPYAGLRRRLLSTFEFTLMMKLIARRLTTSDQRLTTND